MHLGENDKFTIQLGQPIVESCRLSVQSPYTRLDQQANKSVQEVLQVMQVKAQSETRAMFANWFQYGTGLLHL